MAGSRPAPSRASNISQLSDAQKAAMLRRMGITVARSPVASRLGTRHSSSKEDKALWEATKAGLRGAADSLPFGIWDRGSAVIRAAADAAAGRDFSTAYDNRLKAERAQDRYDKARHPTARLVGEIGGNAVQIAIPMFGVGKVARIAEAAPMIFRETGKLIGGGAIGNATIQAVGDGLHRKVSAANIIGAGIGGGLGVVAAVRGRPGAAGAVTGGATSLVQDALSGNLNSGSLLRASGAAATGSLIAGGAGKLRAAHVNRLPIKAKGNLGEYLSERRTWLRGDTVVNRHAPVAVRGGNTRPDHLTARGQSVEAKFGPRARLSPRQREAYEGDIYNYRVDHFLPRDIGAMIETPLGMLVYQNQKFADARSVNRNKQR